MRYGGGWRRMEAWWRYYGSIFWRPVENAAADRHSNHNERLYRNLPPIPYHYHANNNQYYHNLIILYLLSSFSQNRYFPLFDCCFSPAAALILPTFHLFVLLVLKWFEAITHHTFYIISCVTSPALCSRR